MAFVPVLVQLSWRASVWAAGAGLGLAWTRVFGGNPYPFPDAEERVMAEWSGAIELRKLHVRYSRAPSGGIVEDVAINTFTFLKLDGSDVPTSTWLDADMANVEAEWGTAWGSIKSIYGTITKLDQFRWYPDGDAWRPTPPEGNPAIRTTEVDVAGSVSSGYQLPPQVAISVTEKTAIRKEWGRFYLPAPYAAGMLDGTGRISTTCVDLVQDAVEAFYNNLRADRIVPVVFAQALPERPKKPAGTLPARTGAIYEVLAVQTDNLSDVIRSRRYSAPTQRDSRTLAALP